MVNIINTAKKSESIHGTEIKINPITLKKHKNQVGYVHFSCLGFFYNYFMNNLVYSDSNQCSSNCYFGDNFELFGFSGNF